ncbi:WYL domain-containing protein [Deinococcus aerophilus]|nr:WYL domain-containing protein [Deinococcus aerophilus]
MSDSLEKDSSGLSREVIPWILSFGSRVSILGPDHTRA